MKHKSDKEKKMGAKKEEKHHSKESSKGSGSEKMAIKAKTAHSPHHKAK